MRGPEEEGCPELALQPVKTGGEGRLRDEKRFRRPAHASTPSDFQEPFDLDQLDRASLAVTRFVYSHSRGDKFYLWRRRSDTPDQMASAHTGPIVMTKGRIVSLAEFELRSKARNTSTVP